MLAPGAVKSTTKVGGLESPLSWNPILLSAVGSESAWSLPVINASLVIPPGVTTEVSEIAIELYASLVVLAKFIDPLEVNETSSK